MLMWVSLHCLGAGTMLTEKGLKVNGPGAGGEFAGDKREGSGWQVKSKRGGCLLLL